MPENFNFVKTLAGGQYQFAFFSGLYIRKPVVSKAGRSFCRGACS